VFLSGLAWFQGVPSGQSIPLMSLLSSKIFPSKNQKGLDRVDKLNYIYQYNLINQII
jgi:hypothetical protein